jgi:hypothetical protein
MNWTPDQIERVRELLSEKLTYVEVAARMGVSRGTIAKLILRTPELREMPDRNRTRGRTKAEPAPAPRRSAFRVVSNNIPMMTADWLEKHGGARRYEAGFSTDYLTMKSYLERHGVTFNLTKNQPTLSTGRGRPRKVTWTDVFRAADKFRVAEGLTPILRESAA